MIHWLSFCEAEQQNIEYTGHKHSLRCPRGLRLLRSRRCYFFNDVRSGRLQTPAAKPPYRCPECRWQFTKFMDVHTSQLLVVYFLSLLVNST